LCNSLSFEAVKRLSPGTIDRTLGPSAHLHNASADAAAIQAAYRVLITYFSGSALMLNTARANSLALIPDGQPKVTA